MTHTMPSAEKAARYSGWSLGPSLSLGGRLHAKLHENRAILHERMMGGREWAASLQQGVERLANMLLHALARQDTPLAGGDAYSRRRPHFETLATHRAEFCMNACGAHASSISERKIEKATSWHGTSKAR